MSGDLLVALAVLALLYGGGFGLPLWMGGR
jgi:hypothetical protein